MKTGKITATIPHKITPTEDMSYKKKEKTKKIKGEEEVSFFAVAASHRLSEILFPFIFLPAPLPHLMSL